MRSKLSVNLVTIFLFCLIIFSSCSTTKPESLEGCIQDTDAEKILKPLERIVDSASQSPIPLQTNTISSECRKRVYSRGSYRMIVFRQSEKSGLQGTTIPFRKSVSPEEAGRCMKDALADLRNVGIPYLDFIIRRHQALYPALWLDADIGPAHWLKCANRPSSEFNESENTFLHELNHDLRQSAGQCVFLASENRPLCFQLPPSLPKISIAKLSAFPSTNPTAREGMKYFEDIYLDTVEGGPFMLFDELHSYTISTDVLAAILKQKGKRSLIDEKGHREYIALPQVMVYVLRYLQKLKAEYPEDFTKDFGKESLNRSNLEVLLGCAEKSYRSWLTSLNTIKEKPKDAEENLWRHYLNLKRELIDKY